MARLLCKYCGKTMAIEKIDYYHASYKCDCDDHKKQKELEQEIAKTETYLLKKRQELKDHIANSTYEQRFIQEYENKITEIKNKCAEIKRIHEDSLGKSQI